MKSHWVPFVPLSRRYRNVWSNWPHLDTPIHPVRLRGSDGGYQLTRLVEIGRVVCTGDNGSRHVVIQRQKMIEHAAYGKAKGTIDFITTTGMDVNQLDDGTFQVVMTDQILRPVST